MKNLPARFYINVDAGISENIQLILFKNGIAWVDDIDGKPAASVRNLDKPVLVVLQKEGFVFYAQPYEIEEGDDLELVMPYDFFMATQTTEDLIEENASLATQLDQMTAKRGRLMEELEELGVRYNKKVEFYNQNANLIKENIPESVKQYAPYL